ncbi:MAG: hypothetical protein AAF696_08510 [Bacteroidota bacterium]
MKLNANLLSYLVLLFLLSAMMLVNSSCEEETPQPAEITADFAVEGMITGSGDTYTATFTNNTLGSLTKAIWDFGMGASPATATVINRGEQVVTYPAMADPYSVTVKLTVEGEGGAMDEITKMVEIPAAIDAIGNIPAGAACADSFEDNPACFCNDPANANDPKCASINLENGDMETDGLPTGSSSASWGAFWEIYGDRQGGEAVFSQPSEGGSKVMRVDINAFGGDCTDCPWALQVVTEPDGSDDGWATPEGQSYVVLADIHASKAGMKVWMAPGQSGTAGYGAIDLDFPETVLKEGWNKVAVFVENDEGRALDDMGRGIRGEMAFNFPENVGGILHIDNYKLIPVEGEVVMQIPSSLDGSGIDFENPDYDPMLGPFTDGGTITSAVIDNPDAMGINTSSKVAEVVQSENVISWAGVSINNLLAAPIDWNNGRKIQVDVWSPGVGQNVNLKLENAADNNINTELSLPSTVANAWETLTFEFPADVTDGKDLSRVVLFFNFDGDKSMTTTHYFDNVKQIQ